ncbi:MAG: class I SAM-dependent DNA methyltransferase [Bdellovibrionales bacterium]
MTDFPAPQEFWERKILKWEKFRYSQWFALYPLSWSVRARLKQASRIIKKRAPVRWTILELGCGSGLLAEKLKDHCSSFEGMDIAQNAVARARERVPQFTFKTGDVLTAEIAAADLTVFLGLSDWLDQRGLQSLFAKINSPHILFSYTNPSGWNPYRLYRKMMDPPGRPGLSARTYREDEIRELLVAAGFSMERMTRPTLMNPGVLVWAEKIT